MADAEAGEVIGDGITADLVDALAHPLGSLALRPVHSLGVGATGSFVASDVAKNFCVAAHFNGDTLPVTARFSNGSGSAVRRDGWSDVRGLATRFHLPDGTATDLVMMTLREFFTPDAESFLKFARAATPKPFTSPSPLQRLGDYLKLKVPTRAAYPGETIRPDEGAITFADAHAYAQLPVFEAAAIGAPVSYARAAYHAVHTFVLQAPDGGRHHVRFDWLPAVGMLNTDPRATPVDVYLDRELHQRIAADPVRFILSMVIGEIGDAFDDPTRPWPPHRQRIVMGTLTLDQMLDGETTERLSFNPWLLTAGIEPSGDPVLRTRRDVYRLSAGRRGATPCPFMRSDEHGG